MAGVRLPSDHQHEGMGSRIGLGLGPARSSSPRMGSGDVGPPPPVYQSLASKALEES